MDGSRGEGGERRLRAVREGDGAAAAALVGAIAAVLEASRGGLPPRALPAAVAEHLGLPPEAVGDRQLTAALGTAVATGRVDEVGGRLVAVTQERREAG